ncbi:cytochrome c biogenesis protein ResB [Shouchella sp. 1P09AA]|uniref:cytochrome c biogenesis protein ResB n=1 Tax=unclassified Shouchella TaxID=2893065 RepID=UPI0039A33C8B
MNENIVCSSCANENREGTLLCRKCGKPLDEDMKQQNILNMRYEGAARRSQKYKKTIVDKIWNFFSSVKIGVSIIIILVIASAIGTIFPQEMYIPNNVNPAQHYQQEYGQLGKIYYNFGFHNLYSSWWYLLLLAALTISLLIASIDRFFPLYRSLKNQSVVKHDHFMKRQRFVSETNVELELVREDLIDSLKKKKYKIRSDGQAILAEKGRFSRWGPYINHIGLILFLIGGMLRFVPGMFVDESLWIRDGDTMPVPGTNGEYYLKSDQFLVELYDEEDEEDAVFQEAIARSGGEVIKTFETSVTLFKKDDLVITSALEPNLEKVQDYKIQVNDPLTFSGFSLYQVSYRLNELSKMRFELVDSQTGNSLEYVDIDLFNLEASYELENGYILNVTDYFPNFYLNEGIPSTRSTIPDNPAFVFELVRPGELENEVSFWSGVATSNSINDSNQYVYNLIGVETRHVSNLTVRKDYTLSILIGGAIIFMVGLLQGSYWTHRRIWIKSTCQQSTLIAAHTNKNGFSFKKEVDQLITEINLNDLNDRAESEKRRDNTDGTIE